MPSITTNTVSKAQAAAYHNQTISDPKKGVTFAGQEQLKRLPIPTLEETCQHYLESVRPFLVLSPQGISNLERTGICRYEGRRSGFSRTRRTDITKEITKLRRQQIELYRTILYRSTKSWLMLCRV